MSFPDLGLLLIAGFAAGVMNAIAGGGTLLTFPALLAAGVPAIIANATSTVALLPGTLGGILGYRRTLPEIWRWTRKFAFVSVLGGLIGGFLLLRTPESTFERLVPFLILFATILFTAREAFFRIFRIEVHHVREEPTRAWFAWALLFQFAVSIYGGYFGAGIGILMLATLGFLGFRDIHQMNAVKGVLALLINLVAGVYFIWATAIEWKAAAVVALGAVAGGYFGAHFAQRISQEKVRHAISAVGLVITGVLFYNQLRP